MGCKNREVNLILLLTDLRECIGMASRIFIVLDVVPVSLLC